MPTAGLSLVGFMEEQHALHHLRNACVAAVNADDAALRAIWAAAHGNLGASLPNAGHPDLQPIPVSHAQYLNNLMQQPWVQQRFVGQPQPVFHMVEIDPLLAFQIAVDTDRLQSHCGSLQNPPSLDEVFNVCLPMAVPVENYNWQRLGQSAIIKSTHGLNLRVLEQGIVANTLVGLIFGAALPFTQVARLNGRVYLSNGYHRAVGLRRAGATHMPCSVRDVPDAQAVGIKEEPWTFSTGLLTSADPPTVGHFARGSAHNVQLRKHTRILHVSWADYVWPDE